MVKHTFSEYIAFRAHNSIATPSQLRVLASAPAQNCRKSSKKDPADVKDETNSVKPEEGSGDEEGGDQKDDVDDVQVRDIRYNLETLSQNQIYPTF